MKILKSFVGLLAAGLLLAGCGGSGNTLTGGGGGGGGGGGSGVATVTVNASPTTIAADGSTTSAITATALSSSNVGVANLPVVFATTTGGQVAVVSGTTDANGNATATLSNVSAAAGANLTVSATIGGVMGSTSVGVVAVQQSLTVETDMPQIPSDGSKSANLTALLRDANNNALAGVTVSFSSTSGVLTVTQAVTDANGIAKATLNSGTDPTNRTITVTASAGSASTQISVQVTGTTLTLTGPANLVLNNSGTCTVVLANSSGQGIPGATVTVSSANGNTLSAMSLTTDGNGRATFTLTGTHGGTDTVTAAADGLSQQISVTVSTQSFNITAPANNTNVNLGVLQTVTVTWLNNGAPVVGQPVTFASTRGTLNPTTPVVTNASGQASVQISSTSAGPSIIAATATGVSASLTINFVALVPNQISVQAGPSAVAVQGQSTITALVRDAANNLVEGATVDFQVVTDPTNGGLSVASAVTDAQGRAQTVYTAGNSSSGANGVTISATVSGTAITASTQLTVGGQTVFLSLGTGNTIDTSQGVAIYQITYTVFAVDSHGAALPNVPITLSILPVAYGKGVMGSCGVVPGAQYWTAQYSTQGVGDVAPPPAPDPDSYNGTKLCKNEDTDYTGNINSLGFCPSGSNIPCKDYNLNGKLDPGNVAVVSPSSGTTDANGRLDVKITWPRDHSYWVEVSLVASTTVQGTQSSTSSTFVLPGALADYACNIGPPGSVSPYGVANTCANPN